MSAKFSVSKIIIDRAEGPIAQLTGPCTFQTFRAASAFLREQAHSAPATGGYDKCDVTIVWAAAGKGRESDHTHEFRLDLTREHERGIDIGEESRTGLAFYAGRHCPGHLTPERYADFLHNYVSAADQRTAAELLDSCMFSDLCSRCGGLIRSSVYVNEAGWLQGERYCSDRCAAERLTETTRAEVNLDPDASLGAAWASFIARES